MYPVTIIKDSFNGKYSGFKYLAFNDTPDKVNSVHYMNDFALNFVFWDNYEPDVDGLIGLGNTPEEAENDLYQKVYETKSKEMFNNQKSIVVQGQNASICKELDDLKNFI